MIKSKYRTLSRYLVIRALLSPHKPRVKMVSQVSREEKRLGTPPCPRPHTYTDYIGRIIATLISASRHSIPTLCHTYTIILVRKNAFYSKFWNIHSHGTMRLRQVSPCAQLQVLLSVSQTHRGMEIESIHAHTTSSQSSSENRDPRGPVFRT